MHNVPLNGPSVGGYDVSHYQPNMSIHSHMAAAGKKFCLIKADEGATVVDHLFKAHYQAAKSYGMKVGFYNFFHPSQNAHKQAQHILGLIGGLNSDMGAICDLEKSDGLWSTVVSGAAFQFLKDVKAVMGKAILYGSPYFLRDTVKIDDRFLEFPLWVAQYGPSTAKGPMVPPPYTDWDIWQYTDKGGADLNLFNGDMAALELFCK